MGNDQKFLFGFGILMACGLIFLEIQTQEAKPEPEPDYIAYEGEPEIIKIKPSHDPLPIRINMPPPSNDFRMKKVYRPQPIHSVHKDVSIKPKNKKKAPIKAKLAMKTINYRLAQKMADPRQLKDLEIRELLNSVHDDNADFIVPKTFNKRVVFKQPLKYKDFKSVVFQTGKREPATKWAHGFEIKEVIEKGKFEQMGFQAGDKIFMCNFMSMNHDENILSCFKKLSKGQDVAIHYKRNGQERIHIYQFEAE